jgi:hypothetical protein
VPAEEAEAKPIKWIGVILGTFLTLIGLIFAGLGFVLMAEDPPAGAFIGLAGTLLAVLGAEVVTQSLGDSRPSWWPEHIIRRP